MVKPDRFHGRERSQRECDWTGCRAPGEFRAPRKAGSGHDDHWFCLEHVRQFNSGWDYFEGMSRSEIEAAQAATNTWERPTWTSHDAVRHWHNRDMEDLFDLAEEAPFDMVESRSRHFASAADRRALKVLGLDVSATAQEIKGRFKCLVRRYHPDSNQGDRRHEGRLRRVIAAYQQLMNRQARPPVR